MSKPLPEIERLVINTAKEAQKETINLQEKVDALKILAPYYALLKRAESKEANGEDDPHSLKNLVSQIHEADDGPSYGLRDRTSGRN